MMRSVRSMVPTLAFIMTSRSASAPAFQRREQQHSSEHGEHEHNDLPVPAQQHRDRRPGADPGDAPPTPNNRLPRSGDHPAPAWPATASARRAANGCAPSPGKGSTAVAMAPTITSASEGSQAPARSRKPMTLAGLVMPERSSPSRTAARRRMTSTCACSTSQQMTQHKDRGEAGGHERQGGHNGARRQSRDPQTP